MSRYSENIIIGAGAAGLFCAAQLGKLGKQVTIFDNGKKIGRKIFAKTSIRRMQTIALYPV